MVSALLSRCLILVLGTLYPAYRSYKAIKNKDLREHVKWMMYWIVFALFTTLETFLDIFVSWFPFYYEIKILFILWVLSPATRGSSILYKKIVHPMLISREQEIDELIEKTKVQGYSTFIQLFTSGFNYASNLFMNSAMRGQSILGQQLKRNLSLDVGYEQERPNIRSSKSNDGYFGRDSDQEISSDLDDLHETEYIKKSVTKNPKKSTKKTNYEFVEGDDEILMAVDTSKKTSSSRNTGSKRKTSKQATVDNKTINEYGTITRGKNSKSRTQLIQINESDQ